MAKERFCCDCEVIHREAVDAVTAVMPNDEAFERVAEFFKLLGDRTRMKIIRALDESELCVCDLANVLGMTKSAVSHQLSLLRRANLVRYRRDGKSLFYSLADDHVRHMCDAGFEHLHD